MVSLHFEESDKYLKKKIKPSERDIILFLKKMEFEKLLHVLKVMLLLW